MLIQFLSFKRIRLETGLNKALKEPVLEDYSDYRIRPHIPNVQAHTGAWSQTTLPQAGARKMTVIMRL